LHTDHYVASNLG